MPARVPPIATIPLARSIPRLLAWPLATVVANGSIAVVALLGIPGQPLGYAIAAIGGLLSLGGVVAAIVFLTVRLDIEEATVRVRWLGGQRAYPLARGPVTRVRLRGEGSSSLRPNIGAIGWGVGTARLRDEEEIHVVRLAPTSTAILVPTEVGRLAIAAASEPVLLEALGRAARARQRLEELAVPVPAVADREPVEHDRGADEPSAQEPAGDRDEPRPLTGIERARLAAEQAAPAAASGEDAEVAEPDLASAGAPEATGEAVPATVAHRRLRRPTLPRPRLARPLVRRPTPSTALVVLPLIGAGAAWAIGQVLGTMPAAGSDMGRVTALALVLAGPVTTVGAIMARAWWPRLVGVVVTGGLLASLFIGRALVA